ncbi:MAG: methylenetetrahydrofolate reductase C-terminal domain-containing protein [Candidatus Aminicenantes bacterium]|nr:MAG: methylenetetrahydrofolate reductase C-terminal domain-containing protein [Candidatus Aminicenantes bacterium]
MAQARGLRDIATLRKSTPTGSEKILSRIMLFLEDIVKVTLFRCQRCGECLLSHTGFVCSQRCPKRLRNGPCGGTGKNGTCEVYPERKCIWYRIYQRARLLGRLSLLQRIEKIHNWELEKTSAWLNVFKKRIEPPIFFIRREEQNDTKRKN